MKLLFSKPKISTIGANTRIKNQINSLNIEKDILTKTIARLYQHDMNLTKIQRDRLLIRYQHQLGIVLAKIEKLDAASKHPDFGPLGDGLITLMDQKLSQLDKRLYEISSKINISNTQSVEIKPKIKEEKSKDETKKIVSEPAKLQKEPSTLSPSPPNQKAVELTTLTELPTGVSGFPLIDQKPRELQMEIIKKHIEKPEPKLDEKMDIIKTSVSPVFEKTEIKHDGPSSQEKLPVAQESKPKPTINLPEEEKIEDDDDDLDKIKGEIMKTLSKLEQAEVE